MSESPGSGGEPRAVAFREVAGVRVPARYSSVEEEYAAARSAAAVAERDDLARLRMWGRDPVKMLQGLITNDLAGAPEGRGVYAAMLTPRGRTIAELRAFPVQRAGGTEVWIELPREALAGTTAHLKKFVPPMFARWEDASERTGGVGVHGPRAREVLARALGTEVPALEEDAFVEVAWHDPAGEGAAPLPVLVTGSRETGEPGYELIAERGALASLRGALLAAGAEAGARPVGLDALEVLRIEAGRPRYGRELTEETIPTEAYESTGLMPRAISFTKGCYTGQEVIVRIAHRGHVNRHLRGLLLGDAAPPGPGTPLLHPRTGKPVGAVTSAARSPRMGQTVALGMVRREIEPGGEVRVGEMGTARVVGLPFGGEQNGGSE